MRHEIRVTIEVLDADTVGKALDSREVLLGHLDDGELEPGALGEVEMALDEIVEELTR